MRTILILAAALAFAIPVGADHCTTYSTSLPEVDTGPLPDGSRYYVDNDLCYDCTFSIWVYAEANGIDGLQRGDEVVDDTCHDSIVSDKIIL